MEKIKYILILALIPVFAAANPPFKAQKTSFSIFDRDVLEYYPGTVPENIRSSDAVGPDGVNRKSPFLAGIMSAAIPGAGEVYAGRWVRGLMHFGVEVTGWVFYFHYNSRGDRQTAFFEDYADTYWSVIRYVDWLNEYWGADIGYLDENNLPPWERVNWQDINNFEATISQFSHRLEPYGTQQYYELIGKYPQYNRGWEDSIPHEDHGIETGEGTGNPGLYFTDISDKFNYYSGQRGYANTLYARAHNAVIVVFINHIISAFHAAYLAHRYNETHFAVDIENRRDLYGDRFIPTVRFRVGF